jgi:hypothetical protein
LDAPRTAAAITLSAVPWAGGIAGPVPGNANLHHAVDDHSRLACSETLADVKKETAADFWTRPLRSSPCRSHRALIIPFDGCRVVFLRAGVTFFLCVGQGYVERVRVPHPHSNSLDADAL